MTRLQGGHPDHAGEVTTFREFASNAGHFLDEAPPELSIPPWDEDNEHQVWFQPESATYLKATWPDHFGMRVIHRLNEEPSASPIEYLERWVWHNRLFGDTVEFIGAFDTDSGLRLIIRQPAIEGAPPRPHAFFIFTPPRHSRSSELTQPSAAEQPCRSPGHCYR